MSRLSIEMVPRTCWYTNVRSNVTRAEWERCKNFVKKRSGSRCEVCGGVGRRYPVDCHEIWEYDDETQVQTLVDLIALCPACHEVKHFGRTEVTGRMDDAFEHLKRVNGWGTEHAFAYVKTVYQIWELRSQVEWTLDISWLETLGINPNVTDRDPVR